MKIKRIVKPGDPGTKKLVQRFGEKLVCVRYRYDDENNRVLKTVELIIEDTEWKRDREKIPKNKVMCLRVDINETKLQKRIRENGGKWDGKERVWRLPYKDVLELGLTDRRMKGGKKVSKYRNKSKAVFFRKFLYIEM